MKPHSAPDATVLPDRFVFIGYAGNAVPVIRVGNPIASPLVVGPDPSATGSDQLQPSDGDLKIPEPMRWMVDFDRAVDVGMGFRIDLDELQDRVHAGDRFLLCTDGLTREVPEAQMRGWMEHQDVRAAVDGLIKAALDAGGRDNVTALIVEARA